MANQQPAGHDDHERSLARTDGNPLGRPATARQPKAKHAHCAWRARNTASRHGGETAGAAARVRAPGVRAGAVRCRAARQIARVTLSATASPPPRQSVARPVVPPRSASAYSSVMSTRAPLAPIGWPSAIAPPFTFTRRRIQPKRVAVGQRLGGKRLVRLDEVEVADRRLLLRQQVPHGADGREEQVLRMHRAGRIGIDAREHLESVLLRECLA